MDVEQLFQVILLGIVQGIAEFLPISSSGHLVIVNALLPDSSSATSTDDLAMNIALHLGTLGSILVVYRRDLRNYIRDFPLILSVILATIPIVVVGFTLKDHLEMAFSTPAVAAVGLLVTATFLSLSDWLGSKDPIAENPEPKTPTWWQALLVGCFQAVAIVPGISRSGSTIAGGVMVGISREDAARFSFLIAIPAIAGATLLHAKEMLESEAGLGLNVYLLIGAAVSFVVGIGALEMLLKIVRRNRLRYFAVYCVIVSLVTMYFTLA
ncbi:undecaprenyl-diphosphate phosphatase [Rubinisphaera margarita]|uniref:undecaprenyl-diphosphate phosphatase n=1 Tax=Rubinisphaera margarita TaxID=2909586 RepID=UPI001EE796D5|nr:undecaprenyl-diphosphate phosphatase [Rubinisphaera margarita]MCG6157185.1 undecaprenyl-diphosphate phosphatase [Rubinisphaera margarita]